MGLNEWERHELDLVQETLRREDPALAARLRHAPCRKTPTRVSLAVAAVAGRMALALCLLFGMAVALLALSLFWV